LTLRIGALGLGLAVALAPVAAASATKKPVHHKAKAKAKHHGSATTTTAARTANFNSCSVITQAEAAGALGASVSAGVLGTATVEGGLACVFYGPSAPSPRNPNIGQLDTVRVVVVKGSDAVTWYNSYKTSPTVRAEAISGYGNQAYYDGYASLSVLKGDSYLRVAVIGAGTPPSLSAEEQLANAILPKL